MLHKGSSPDSAGNNFRFSGIRLPSHQSQSLSSVDRWQNFNQDTVTLVSLSLSLSLSLSSNHWSFVLSVLGVGSKRTSDLPPPMASCCCGRRALALVVLATAIPFALIASMERAATAANGSFKYRSGGWLRECAKWDHPRRRFLVSTFFDGGIAEIRLPDIADGSDIQDRTWIADADVAGNASLGIAIDGKRDRLLVVYADVMGLRSSAVAAYGLESGERLFLTRLSRPDDEPSYADDVAVDGVGNAYVTDTKANKIWKVGLKGELLSIIRNNLFVPNKAWYRNLVGLNGIVYHQNGYLLVIHTAGGYLFKVDTNTEEVRVVRVAGSLLLGDGLELLSPTKLVVAGTPSARIVESFDDWNTAAVTERFIGPLHRIATSATTKEGKIYINHLLGLGITGRNHALTVADFSPLNAI